MSVNLVDMAEEYQSERAPAPRPQGPLRVTLVRDSLADLLETSLGVLDALVTEGFEVCVIAPEDASPAALELRGIEHVRVPRPRWRNPASMAAAFLILQGKMLERPPTLVHARGDVTLWLGALAAARAQAGALVVTVEDHTSVLDPSAAPPLQPLVSVWESIQESRVGAYRWLGRVTDAYICASATELKALYDAEIVPGANLHVMPGLDGVEVGAERPVSPAQGPLRLGVVTDGSRSMGYERAHLMRAYGSLRWFEVDASAELPPLDALIVLRRSQGIEPAILEAMARGVPCAAYRTPGSASLVEDGRTGWLVESAMSTVVRGLERAECERRGAQSFQEARRRFARGRAQTQLLELYARVLERKFT